eukprot:symbB.v1.2.018745.t1/scaffold1508.1/size114708/4
MMVGKVLRARLSYTDEEKEAAPQDWIRELMKLADVNSNKKGGGGTAEFRNLQARVIEMAPEMWKERIRNVQFLAKTKGIHGAAIDNIIDEILQGSEAEPEPIQDIQDVGCAQLRVSDPVDLPAVKEPLEEKMADAAVADCQEGQHLVAGSGSAASSGGVSAESLNDSATPSAKKPRIMMIPTPARLPWEAMVEKLAELRSNEAKQAEEILRLKARNSELEVQVQLKNDELEELQHLYEAEARKNQNLKKEMQRQIAQKEEQEKNLRAAKQNLLEQKHLRLMNDSAGVGRHL